MITTVCYGIEDHWDSRKDAIEYFETGMIFTEGSERERYFNVWYALMKGANFATDGDDNE